MTDKQILQKAMKKANKNGYREPKLKLLKEEERLELFFAVDDNIPLFYVIIFSHDFAKAFWGKKQIEIQGEKLYCNNDKVYEWQMNLQQMVLEPEPLQYIKKFLD